MCSRESFEVWSLSPASRGRRPGEDALDVFTRERHGEHGVHVLEQVVDVGRGRGGVRLVEVPVGVGRADQPVPAPRDHEQHALLGAEDHAHGRLDAVARHHEVDALRRAHLERAALADHALRVVGPDAGGVHDLLRAHLEVLVGLQVVGLHADDALADLDEALDLDPARDVGAVERRGAGEGGDVAGIVDLRVVVGEAADEGVGASDGIARSTCRFER